MMMPGDGCASRTCVRPARHYRSATFIRRQLTRAEHIMSDSAYFMAPPLERGERVRLLLTHREMVDAISDVLSMLYYA